MKAVLVIDMPNNCEECKIIYLQEHGERSSCDSGDWLKRPSWCPLRPLPQRKDNSLVYQGEINADIPINFLEKIYNQGYNACLDDITGEKE